MLFVVSDERLRTRRGYKSHDTTPLLRRFEMSQVEPGGAALADPFVSCQSPSGFTRWRAPVCHGGRRLPTGGKTNSQRKNIVTSLQGGKRRSKKHKCKYFKRSVALHHCWLCLILWASTNNGRWDSPETLLSVSLQQHIKHVQTASGLCNLPATNTSLSWNQTIRVLVLVRASESIPPSPSLMVTPTRCYDCLSIIGSHGNHELNIHVYDGWEKTNKI